MPNLRHVLSELVEGQCQVTGGPVFTVAVWGRNLEDLDPPVPFKMYEDPGQPQHRLAHGAIAAPIRIHQAIGLQLGQPRPVTGADQLQGEPIDGEDSETYGGQRIVLETPVDANAVLSVLVETPGSYDWELQFRIKQPGTATGPVHLKRLERGPET